MIYPNLKKWAQSNNWVTGKDKIHGEYNGYSFTAFDGPNIKCFMTALPALTESQKLGVLEDLEGNKELLNISEYSIYNFNGSILKVVFTESKDTPMDQHEISIYLDYITATFKRLDIGDVSHCFNCNSQLLTEKVLLDDILVSMCTQCYEQVNETYNKAESELNAEEKNYGLGFLGALLGGLVGAIPWALLSYFGWYAGIIGFVIGFLALKGYKLLGGKIGKLTPWMIGGLTVFCILLAELAANMISVNVVLNEYYVGPFSFGDVFRVFINLLVDPEAGILSGIMINLLIGLVLAFLGTRSLFKDMGNELGSKINAPKAVKI